ncbi:metal-dependent hydrolase family protein [Streptomyces lushanensis]|uniref:metal-dependent hydrolase family protein n=1 Tax=Streptomyces lushanensis TaxID=1434255 RepID=UPI00082A9098|nr:amidohydrolase family protein [Streptomyces lushanensis]
MVFPRTDGVAARGAARHPAAVLLRPGEPGPDRYLITADRVWDGLAPEPVRDGFLLVEGARIGALGRRADLGGGWDTVPRLDLPGATVLPGLIDCHVHMALSGSATPVRDFKREARAGAAALAVRAVQNLRLAAEAGVTTVRDLGTPNEVAFPLRAAVAEGRIPGPRVLTSGQPITVTGGHCHWFSHQCDSPAEIRVAVRRQVRDGADWIKLMLSGGNLTPRTNPGRPQYSEEEVRACTEESERLGVPVSAHAYDPDSIRRAVDAGVRTIEHCLFETADGIAYDPTTAILMAARGIAFVPTISGAFLRMGTAGPEGRDPVAPRFRERRTQIREVFRRMVAAGVPMVAGSDAGVPQRAFDGFPADLAALVGADGMGLTCREALVSATSAAAERLGVDDTGVLAPGRRADVLAVDGDPLSDIGAVVRPRLVLTAGRPVRGPEGAPPPAADGARDGRRTESDGSGT